jgi:hypothetical protein
MSWSHSPPSPSIAVSPLLSQPDRIVCASLWETPPAGIDVGLMAAGSHSSCLSGCEVLHAVYVLGVTRLIVTFWAVGRGSRLLSGLLSGRISSPGTIKTSIFSTAGRPALGPTQTSVRWVTRALYPGGKEAGRPRIRGCMQPLPHTPSWRSV